MTLNGPDGGLLALQLLGECRSVSSEVAAQISTPERTLKLSEGWMRLLKSAARCGRSGRKNSGGTNTVEERCHFRLKVLRARGHPRGQIRDFAEGRRAAAGGLLN